MKLSNVANYLILLSGALSSALFGQTTMNDQEIKALIEYVQKNASAAYVNPGPELYGKYMVCKDLEILAVFDTEAEALAHAEEYVSGSIEIRRVTPTDNGMKTKLILPGAVRKLEE